MDVKYKLIDLSHHNGTVDFAKVKTSGIQGVILRAGYGDSNVDTKFHEYMKEAIAQGLHIGVYWFGYASTVKQAQTEAKLCIDTISQYKGKIDFPVYYDWEDDSYNYIKKTYGITATKQLVSDITNAFCKYCESQGWWSGFYSNPNYLANYYTDTIKSRYALWVANYANKCSYTGSYGIWQYSEKGSISGISGNVDLDYCYVDYPVLIKSKKLNGYGTTNTTITTKTKASTSTATTYPTWNGIKTFSYSKDGNTYLSKHFQVKEFASISGSKLYSDNVLISYDLVQMLEKLFTKLKCTSITINSGYRTATHDKAVGGSGTGQHVLGKASDIVCKNSNGVISSKIVCCVASDLGFGGVANISAKYQATHVDVRTGSQYRGDEIKGYSSIWKYNAKWTDFYTYFGLSKSDVAKYTI